MENLSRERALELHRQMWSEMKEEFGDNPNREERYDFKREWVIEHFPDEIIRHYCFLCEYALNNDNEGYYYTNARVCQNCPIQWIKNPKYNSCEASGGLNLNEVFVDFDDYEYCDWRYSSISDILALPERKNEV